MMISRDVMINGINYTVSATTLRGLDEAIQYLEDSLYQAEKRVAQEESIKKDIERLEEELNQSFDEVLHKFETGELPETEEPKESKFQQRLEEEKAKLSKKKPGRPRKNEE